MSNWEVGRLLRTMSLHLPSKTEKPTKTRQNIGSAARDGKWFLLEYDSDMDADYCVLGCCSV